MNKLSGVDETSKRLGVSSATVRRKIKDGSIRTVRLGRRLLVPEDEVLRICSQGCENARGQEAAEVDV